MKQNDTGVCVGHHILLICNKKCCCMLILNENKQIKFYNCCLTGLLHVAFRLWSQQRHSTPWWQGSPGPLSFFGLCTSTTHLCTDLMEINGQFHAPSIVYLFFMFPLFPCYSFFIHCQIMANQLKNRCNIRRWDVYQDELIDWRCKPAWWKKWEFERMKLLDLEYL